MAQNPRERRIAAMPAGSKRLSERSPIFSSCSVRAVGIDHAGIGTDTDLLSPRVGQGTNKAWPGLTGGFFQAVAGEMLLQGFTPDDIAKVGGGNFCRVFGKVTAGHA
jgi:membrane dipeptidase